MAFGRYGKQLRFYMYLPRGPHDSARRGVWIEQVVRGCWAHGARFSLGAEASLFDWDAALASPATAFCLGIDEPAFSLEQAPLRQCLAQMATTRSSVLTVVGRRVELRLSFDFAIDPHASQAEAALLAHRLKRFRVNPYVDRLELSISGEIGPGDLDDDREETSTHPYVGQEQEFWRWCAILCELTTPLFGVGYSESELTQHGLDEHDLYYRTGGEELLERRLPDFDGIFARLPARYLAADFPAEIVQRVTDETLCEQQRTLATIADSLPPQYLADFTADRTEESFGAALQADVTMRMRGGEERVPGGVQRLRTGGILARPGDPFFTVEAELGFDALRRATQLMTRLRAFAPEPTDVRPEERQDEKRPPLSAETERTLAQAAREYAIRAYELFVCVGYIQGAQHAAGIVGELWRHLG